MSSSEEEDQDSEDDVPLKRYRHSSSSNSSEEDAEKLEKLRRAQIVLRFFLSQSKDEELQQFTRAKSRIQFSYSPYTTRRIQWCNSRSLFQGNFARVYEPGKRFLLLHRFRDNLLNNRWIDVLDTARQFLKFQYNNAKCAGSRVLICAIEKPMTLARCQQPITSQNCDKLQRLYFSMAKFPRCGPKRVQLEFAHLMAVIEQHDAFVTALRKPLRTGNGMYMNKDPKIEEEMAILDKVFTSLINPKAQNASHTALLKSADHWVAAPLAWRGNFDYSNQDLTLIWHQISGINEEDCSNCRMKAPVSCRLRYALALADTISKDKDVSQDSSCGLADMNAQFSELLLHSPSDDLLIFYSETNKLPPKDLLSILFRMLDSPKLAQHKKLWWKLRSTLVASEDDEKAVEEARQQWLGSGRESWWPAFVEELNLPKNTRKFAQKTLSTLQNL